MTKKKIIVIGDLIIDKYLEGTCDRISPEAPVPILKVEKTTYSAGGAANVAKNLKALGANVTLITVFGYDSVMRNIALDVLTGLSKIELFDSSRRFTVKTRLISQNQQLARYDDESNHPINNDIVDELIQKFKELCENDEVEAVILSDYNKGVITPYFLEKFKEITSLLHLKVFADPKQLLKNYERTFLITPNLKEANLMFKTSMKNRVDVFHNMTMLNRIREMLNIENIVITLGDDGAVLLSNYFAQHFPCKKVSVYDVTGAGDTFLAALVYDYCLNKNVNDAIDFANRAASISVSKKGTVTVSLSEIQQSISKIYTIDALQSHVEHLKATNKKIVFANGVFDVLHPGHLHLIKEAKACGDYLIVAINSDASVKKLKGDSRPIFTQDQRALILSSLEDVDAVIIFSEETPFEIISKLLPNILVKGDDYLLENIVGRELVDKVVRVKLKPEISTTKIIEKINN